MPRVAPRILPLLLLALLLAGRDGRAAAQPAVALTILFDTHLHGNLANPADAAITFAHYAGLVAERRAATGAALFVGAGDDLGPSPMSAVFKGAQMVDAFHAAGLDADTFGNHEFDYGPDNLMEQVRASRFAWVSANVRDRRTGDVFAAEAGARQFVLKDVAGVRVGITGAAWQFLSAANAGPDVEVLDAGEALAAVVPRMRAAGAQVVIVLSHMCLAEAEAVAAAVRGIDAIVGDHCAERAREPKVVNGTVIARRGDEYDALGELTLRVEGGRVVGFAYRDHEVTADAPRDAAVAAVLADYTARLEAELTRPLGFTAVPLDARRPTVRGAESNLGNYIADVLRAWGEADGAIMNGGGIRGEKEFPPGVLTRGDVVTILPFNNTATVLRLSGADLVAALENGVSQLPTPAGRFPQVSGLSFRYDPAAAPGSRVRSVTVGGAPLDPARTYTLATNDFLANGGDGYETFKTAEVVVPAQAGPLLSDLLAAAIQREGTIAPRVEGRILAEG
jgi:2',3'-cyclic-nucleotide 2'-phosphodiesterase (5'-nucleotidase family)